VDQAFRDGVYFIPLQPLVSSEFVVYAIAEALGVGMYERETPRSQLLQYLQRRNVLLVLDNFEHLSGAVDLLVDILAHTASIKLVVTSREILNLQGEQIFEVGGLALPDANSVNPIEAYDAIRLFVARAQQVRHEFRLEENQPQVVRICRLVEGAPLAIELAAAWVRILSCKEIADEIEHSADFLSTTSRDVPERHRTMRAVFDHSWKLLSAQEQAAFRRLSVFRGQFTREAAQTITGAPLPVLSALVGQSLLRVNKNSSYTVHELLRQYAAEKLVLEERAHILERHSVYYMQLLQRLDPKVKSGKQIAALDEIELALDNIRQAWRYAVENHRRDLILPAYECLTLYYQMRCRMGEGYDAFSMAARQFASHDEAAYGLLLLSACWFTIFTGSVEENAMLVIARQVADIFQRHQLQGAAGMTFMQLWRVQDAFAALVEANLTAYEARHDQWGIAWSLYQQGALARRHRRMESAKALFEESIATFEQIGDRWGATWPQANRGLLAEDEGRYLDAFQLYKTRLRTCEAIGDAGGVAWLLQQIAKVSLELDDIDKARFCCRESLRVALDISVGNSVNEAIIRIASVYQRMGRQVRAVGLYAAVLNHVENPSYYQRQVEQQLESLKAELPPEVFVRAVQNGQAWQIRELGWMLLDELADQPPVSTQHGIESLSERELEVLRLAAEGLSNREIATHLFVTVGTVKKHLNNVFGKLGVERRTEAIARARELELIQ
jgi:predicted ATPase/DNA-binding CsgD family transcriptional regulator